MDDDESKADSGECLFTVVTVTLNPGRFLEETVATVLAQSMGDFEIIIKDGGSTDGTELREWSDPRVRRHTSKDTGIFDAMNQALALARGRYVHFLNAGDLFVDAEVLADVASTIHDHPGVPFFYGDMAKPESRSGYEEYPDRLNRRFLFMNSVCHQGWFVDRDTYRQHDGFETNCGTAGDRLLLLRMIIESGLAHVHIPRVLVRYLSGGVSAMPENAKAASRAIDAARRELYPGLEYDVWWFLEASRGLMKRFLYDRLGWRAWRCLLSLKHRGLRKAAATTVEQKPIQAVK